MGAALHECLDGVLLHWVQEKSRKLHDNQVRFQNVKLTKDW